MEAQAEVEVKVDRRSDFLHLSLSLSLPIPLADFFSVLLDGVSLSRHVATFQGQGESSSEDEEESLGCLPEMSF